MTTIYRIQDKEGRGPFKPGFSDHWVIARDDLRNLPPWQDDLNISVKELHRICHTYRVYAGCGCLTINQLRRWFIKAEYLALMRRGYRAVKITNVTLLAASNKQCLFTSPIPLAKKINIFSLYL